MATVEDLNNLLKIGILSEGNKQELGGGGGIRTLGTVSHTAH